MLASDWCLRTPTEKVPVRATVPVRLPTAILDVEGPLTEQPGTRRVKTQAQVYGYTV